MSVVDSAKITCRCCRLVARVRDVVGHDLPDVCGECAGHQGHEKYTQLAFDHATLYWERVEEAVREEKRAHMRADAALHTRDQAMNALAEVREEHWMGVEKCTCGRKECRTGQLLATSRIAKLIGATQRRNAS
ncbi:hypothetical protein WCD74_00085 [Actinomycetospora sp. OC33-EN08]|uniref:Uncharacterized protein n=1 Tax=Actinomycetospora aurantiaca TaxID=3129233 RepID=A0ABU8MI56_9PSEU